MTLAGWLPVAGLWVLTSVGCAQNGPLGNDGAGTPDDEGEGGQSGSLSQQEADSLLFMREEEKLARDVYSALDGYGNPFANIQNSEQSHMDAVLALLDRYGLPDPAAGNGPGEFTNETLQSLYGALVTQGQLSEIEALIVGCTIEELDIRDLELAKAEVEHSDIVATYDTLLLGSRNHLRAFYGKLQNRGGSSAPQYNQSSGLRRHRELRQGDTVSGEKQRQAI